jgi:hypothetical protein
MKMMTKIDESETDSVSLLDVAENESDLILEKQSEEGHVTEAFFRGSMCDGDELQ